MNDTIFPSYNHCYLHYDHYRYNSLQQTSSTEAQRLNKLMYMDVNKLPEVKQ